jgi:2'-5' RNA ligase
MQQQMANTTRYPRVQQDLYEYLLVVHPAGEIYEKLMQEKELFSTEYQEQTGINRLPHITVANFMAMEVMEPTLIRWMQRICGQQYTFPVMLNNYSGFPPHTIYLRVQDHQPFQQLAARLHSIDDYVKSSGCPPVTYVYKPCLTLARQLNESVYSRAMPAYSQKEFHGAFTVQELVLVKRKHPYDSCKTVNVFRLQPPPHAYSETT